MTDDARLGYLRDTAPAVRHLFEGIDNYEQIVRGLIPPSQAETEGQIRRYMAAAEEYFASQFSQATLCGAVLQVAFMGVFLFSKSEAIPPDCSTFVTAENKKAIRFCLGRRVRGIPAGLLIYAGRNQCVHWDDAGFDGPTTRVFQALAAAYYEDPLFDMAYELNWPAHSVKAHHVVLNELRWTSYEAYEADMRGMLEPRVRLTMK